MGNETGSKMSIVVNTNVASLSAQRSLSASAAELASAMERLSTGKKINSAADDAAGFAIAERMTAQIRGLNMATKNANDGISMLATAENAASDVTDMLQRMRELAVQAANDVNGVQDRTYLKAELDALVAEIGRVGGDTEFNNTKVFDGNLKGNIQVGADADQVIAFDIKKIDSTELSVNALKIDTHANAKAAITSIDSAITTMAGNRANYGAVSNRLEYTVSNLMNVAEYTASARSRIEDADFAAESARLAKAQVLQQTGTAMLAQANASSQLALQLIR